MPAGRKVMAPAFDIADAMAVRAVAAGTADAHQQKRAFAWIVNGVSQIQRLSFVPESARETDFAEGRRSVGLEMILYAQAPVDELRRLADGRAKRRDDHG